VRPDRIGMRFHRQLFRNVVFACEMARDLPWHVVNLVSNTQPRRKYNVCYSFSPPTKDVRCYLAPKRQHCFTYRTWEGLYAAVIRGRADLDELDVYLRDKSAHYRSAFDAHAESCSRSSTAGIGARRSSLASLGKSASQILSLEGKRAPTVRFNPTHKA
jgi:hypothetical protein